MYYIKEQSSAIQMNATLIIKKSTIPYIAYLLLTVCRAVSMFPDPSVIFTRQTPPGAIITVDNSTVSGWLTSEMHAGRYKNVWASGDWAEIRSQTKV